MVKDNKLFLRIALFFVLSIYLPYVLFDYFSQTKSNQNTALEKAKNIVNTQPNALILGGSNAFYSLEAEYFSWHTKFTWSNLALNYEGFSDKNYWSYIAESLTSTQREQIENVVYSSVRPFRSGSIKRREQINNMDEFGIKHLSVFPTISLASRMKSWLSSPKKKESYDKSTKFGDLIFLGKNCKNPKPGIFSRELDPLILSTWVSSQIETMSKLFPKAKIFFVLPSEFYNISYNKIDDDTSFLIILRTIRYLQSNETKIRLIRQPRFPSKEFTCNGRHHANNEGRLWRSENLLNSLEEHL